MGMVCLRGNLQQKGVVMSSCGIPGCLVDHEYQPYVNGHTYSPYGYCPQCYSWSGCRLGLLDIVKPVPDPAAEKAKDDWDDAVRKMVAVFDTKTPQSTPNGTTIIIRVPKYDAATNYHVAGLVKNGLDVIPFEPLMMEEERQYLFPIVDANGKINGANFYVRIKNA
jgi:hypothetical protein